MKMFLKYLYCRYFVFKKCKVQSQYVSTKAQIGEGTTLAKNVVVAAWAKIGKYTYVNINTSIEGKIGNFCSIGQNCAISGGTHAMEFMSTSQRLYSSRSAHYPANIWGDSVPYDDMPPEAEIGSDVWIGAYSVILPKVKIGHGAVIGAGSVVTKDIPPYAIAAGNPAKIIRYRFEPEQIEWLLKSKWWDLPLDQLQKYRDLFASGKDWWTKVKEDSAFES